ncbi:MAG: hypothetical protein MPW15_25620 [Candidatus Manganitrophus sp.]|nr:hypothetical protein [Candidatus Manganitrophus sp.]
MFPVAVLVVVFTDERETSVPAPVSPFPKTPTFCGWRKKETPSVKATSTLSRKR